MADLRACGRGTWARYRWLGYYKKNKWKIQGVPYSLQEAKLPLKAEFSNFHKPMKIRLDERSQGTLGSSHRLETYSYLWSSHRDEFPWPLPLTKNWWAAPLICQLLCKLNLNISISLLFRMIFCLIIGWNKAYKVLRGVIVAHRDNHYKGRRSK